MSCLTCSCPHNLTCTRHSNATRHRLKLCHKNASSCTCVLHGSGASVALSGSIRSTACSVSAEQVAALTQQVQTACAVGGRSAKEVESELSCTAAPESDDPHKNCRSNGFVGIDTTTGATTSRRFLVVRWSELKVALRWADRRRDEEIDRAALEAEHVIEGNEALHMNILVHTNGNP